MCIAQMLNGQLTGKGEIFDGDVIDAASLTAPGWAGVPDTEQIPKLADGSMLDFSNILNKSPADSTYLPVNLDPEPSDDDPEVLWDDMDHLDNDDDLTRWYPNWRAEGRIGLESLQVGLELEGIVVEQHLYYGAVIDCNCEFDGLIWVLEEDWHPLTDVLELGSTVRVRVSRILDGNRFRFPLELECLLPDISSFLTVAPPVHRPMNFYADETYDEWLAAQARYCFWCS